VEFVFLERGHIGYQKIENFMLISKVRTYLSDKMPPKKVKVKNKKWNLAKLENSFIIFTFWGGILSRRQVCFFAISLNISK
jgi:hypothetical protein